MARQALVLMWAGQVCQVMTTHATLGARLPCGLQGHVLWGLQAGLRLQEEGRRGFQLWSCCWRDDESTGLRGRAEGVSRGRGPRVLEAQLFP